jgi:hypothetical protein
VTPTILLAAPQGFAARFLLRTDLLPALRAAGARCVVLVPDPGDEELRAALPAGDGVVLERLDDADAVLARSALRKLFVTLRYFTLGRGHRAPTLRRKAVTALNELRAERPWAARLVAVAVRPLWRSRALRRTLLALETALDRSRFCAEVLERVRPDLVVTTTPGLFYADALLLREAARRGVRTATVVLGWDNPTSKGYRGAAPDLTIAWSERMADQLVTLHDLAAERVAVGGNPHFDRYLRDGALPSREELYDQLALDPSRHVVAFATSSPDLWDGNVPAAEAIAAAIGRDELGAPAQLVIRVHPNYLLPRAGEPIEPYHELAARHPHVVVDVPEIVPGPMRLGLTGRDTLHVGALLRHCDVLVNVFSTTALEALLCDRPVVVLTEEIALREGLRRHRDDRAWDEFEHLQPLLSGGAARVARSLDDVVAHVRDALADPASGREARRAVARQECGPLDGRAGERVARLLLDAV